MRIRLLTAACGWLVAGKEALAVSLGEMADTARDDLALMTGFLEIVFYLLGVLVVVFGFFRVKKHMEQPQQVSLVSAIVAIGVGAAIIAVPPIVNGIGESFGISGGSRLAPPS